MGNQLDQNINIITAMKYIKSYKLFENTDSLVRTHGDIIHKIDDDIQFIKDKCLELEDIGYFVSVNYTPMTLSGFSDIIFFLDIKKDKSMNSFYGELGERRDIVNSVISEVLEYLSDEGYKILNREYKGSEITTIYPKNFKFLNNPTSYQILFTIGDES